MILLAQAEKIAEAVDNAIKRSSSYDGGIYLFSLFLIICAGLFGVYLWQIGIPNARAKRESEAESAKSSTDNAAQLTKATVAISQLVGENYKMTGDIKTDIQALKDSLKSLLNDISRLTNCATTVIQAIEKLAKEANVDIASELGEMRGTLKSTGTK